MPDVVLWLFQIFKVALSIAFVIVCAIAMVWLGERLSRWLWDDPEKPKEPKAP
jgi:hypothetical protein